MSHNPELLEIIKTKKPKRYFVIVLNDDYTDMDFVVKVFMDVFKVGQSLAQSKMLEVHKEGQTHFGPYTHELAEHYATECMDLAKLKGHPLKCILKEA